MRDTGGRQVPEHFLIPSSNLWKPGCIPLLDSRSVHFYCCTTGYHKRRGSTRHPFMCSQPGRPGGWCDSQFCCRLNTRCGPGRSLTERENPLPSSLLLLEKCDSLWSFGGHFRLLQVTCTPCHGTPPSKASNRGSSPSRASNHSLALRQPEETFYF